MTSHEWQIQLDDITAAIAGKEARLAMIPHAKGEAISDNKKLLELEREEAGLPSTIEALKRRLPLLNSEIEAALKVEAVIRLQELEQQGVEAATEVSASRAGIRLGMQSLLDCIREAHATWDAYARIVAELDYLRVRFGVSPQPIPAANRPSPEEQHRFKDEFNLLMRHTPNLHPWSGMLSDYQTAQRRAAEQRQAQADRAHDTARANSLHIATWHTERPLIPRRN